MKHYPAILKVISLLSCAAYLLVMNRLNTLPVDIADGIQHFSIAQMSWKEPVLWLDHWGKPLFTLLASPFAQFGLKAYVGFNILVFVLTCLIAFKAFRQLGSGLAYYLLFPVLLLCVPDYTYCVLGGMTEPLFGLMVVALIYCGWREKWFWFALLASLTPFARSEGMLVVLFGAALLIVNKQWKLIPLVFTGSVIYAVAGWVALDSFWWFFKMDPYPNGSIYGSGKWYHYLVNVDDHTGVLTLLFVPLAVLGWRLFQRNDRGSKMIYTAVFGISIYCGVVIIHSYFWAFGLKGSLGLTRIATLGLPGAMIVLLAGTSFLTRQLSFRVNAVLLALLTAGIAKEFSELKYPVAPNPLEKLIFRAADYAKATYKTEKIYFMSPLIAWRMGENLKDPGSQLKQVDFSSDPEILSTLEEGSIIIRDPVFGPKEQGLPLEFVDGRKELVEIKTFSSEEIYPLYTGEGLKIRILRVVRTP